MNILDISWPITPEMTAYKDTRTVVFEHTKNFKESAVRESKITMSTHTGTHIDAPAHFIEDGITIEKMGLTDLVGPAVVLECLDGVTVISDVILAEFDEYISSGTIILIKTGNSRCEPTALFKPGFVYLDASGAQFLAEREVKAVGIDYLGIERNQPDHETHKLLMNNNIPIIEGLRLGHVVPGEYFCVALPLAVHGLEAAPARVILLQE